MRVVAVINRKGGSGKSTLATHLAGYCARSGVAVMLGDLDRQHSSIAWLNRRAAHAGAAPIVGWAMDRQSVLRPPAGITHVVLDTPGGLRGADLSRAVGTADAVLMPVCASQFDRESALECHAELMAIPRVASGRCKVGVVGMRLDARTRAAAEMPLWAESHGLRYVGVLRDTQNYLRAVEQGLTLFDLAASRVEADLQQWDPILTWLHQTWNEAAQAEQNARATVRPVDARQRRPADLLEPVGRGARQPERSRVLTSTGRLDWLFSVFRSPTT